MIILLETLGATDKVVRKTQRGKAGVTGFEVCVSRHVRSCLVA